MSEADFKNFKELLAIISQLWKQKRKATYNLITITNKNKVVYGLYVFRYHLNENGLKVWTKPTKTFRGYESMKNYLNYLLAIPLN